ncbi:uncharacterized protein LOC128344004 [Hemicordylus capensis]|uniref:uncharacterized protein LOC128344004 n=1 Tax=Hemicordylus capensis TaxID=884348 RepID=UPI0023020FAF|nr:uncharacterized protein LOC128344004 [Hemicordylus capensis]
MSFDLVILHYQSDLDEANQQRSPEQPCPFSSLTLLHLQAHRHGIREQRWLNPEPGSLPANLTISTLPPAPFSVETLQRNQQETRGSGGGRVTITWVIHSFIHLAGRELVKRGGKACPPSSPTPLHLAGDQRLTCGLPAADGAQFKARSDWTRRRQSLGAFLKKEKKNRLEERKRKSAGACGRVKGGDHERLEEESQEGRMEKRGKEDSCTEQRTEDISGSLQPLHSLILFKFQIPLTSTCCLRIVFHQLFPSQTLH